MLEFLGLKDAYSESDLEATLIRLEKPRALSLESALRRATERPNRSQSYPPADSTVVVSASSTIAREKSGASIARCNSRPQ